MDVQLTTLANSFANLLLCDGVCIVLHCANPHLRHPLLTLYLQKAAQKMPYYGTLAYPEILLGERFRALCDIAMQSGSTHVLFNATEVGSSLSGVVFVCPMSMMVAPLDLAEGVVGFVLCTDLRPDAFSAGEVHLLQYQLSSLAFKIENFLYKHLFDTTDAAPSTWSNQSNHLVTTQSSISPLPVSPASDSPSENLADPADPTNLADPADLAELCQDLLQNIQKQWQYIVLHKEIGHIDAKKISFTIYCAFDATIPITQNHADLVRLILLHLLENALLYSPQGGLIEILIHRRRPLHAISLLPFSSPPTTTTSSLSSVYVTVRDHGIGIKPPYQSLVLKPFTRLYHPLTARVAGRGLGLYIAQQLVEKMHGHLSLKSRPNHGTTVTFILPTPCSALSNQHSNPR